MQGLGWILWLLEELKNALLLVKEHALIEDKDNVADRQWCGLLNRDEGAD